MVARWAASMVAWMADQWEHHLVVRTVEQSAEWKAVLTVASRAEKKAG